MSAEFVDSNVIVYAYDRSAGRKHTLARDLLARLWQSREGVVSLQVLQEFYTVVTRKIRTPISATEARERVRNLARWKVIYLTVPDLLAASEMSESARLSFWDGLIVRAAQNAGAITLWSEDLQTNQIFGSLQIRNPFDR